MPYPLTYVELFAGAGGLSLGLETAGWRCVAHAEWDAFPRRVLKARWPDVPLFGDVSELDGTQFKGVTLLTGGSPCQDLSIAGKRAGMTDGTRSSLFHQQIRLWHECEAPFILWENVIGAFSSQNGRDFASVVSAIVGRALAVPRDGWQRGGVASGPTGIAAWRVLDAQYFGVPQRRRRVFVLGTRDPRFDPAEILSLIDGLSGHLASSGEAREGVAADSGTGATGESVRTIAFQNSGDINNRSISTFDEIHPTLRTSTSSDGGVGIMSFEWHGVDSRFTEIETAPTIRTRQDNGQSNVLSVILPDAITQHGPIAGPLVARGDSSPTATQGYNVLVMRQREGKPGGGKGPLLSAERSLTLGTGNDQVLFAGVPRRLTPIECERLMGWPDGWTDVPDDKGKSAADTARYKACGNGVASPVAAWIGFRLRAALEGLTPNHFER